MSENQVNASEEVSKKESNFPPPIIHVFFEEKRYTADVKAADTNLIGLPDGRVVKSSTAWMETYPPQHGKLVVVENPDMSKVYPATLVPENKLKM